MAAPQFVQPGRAGETQQEADVAIAMGGVFDQPGIEISGAAHGVPAFQGTAEHALLVPAPEMLEDVAALIELGGCRHVGHAARHHEGTMGPLPSEQRKKFEHPLRLPHRIDTARTGKRRVARDRLGMQRLRGMGRRGEVRHEHQQRLAHVALHVLRHQRHVAQADRIRGHRDAGDAVERARGGHQVGGAADAADTRGDHQTIERAAPLHDVLEAAEHRARTPGIDDAVVFELDADFQVAFDAVEGNVADDPLRHDGRFPQILVSRFFRRSGAAAAAMPLYTM